MSRMHQDNLGSELFLSNLTMFRSEILRILLSNLVHSVGAAKLKDLPKKVWEQFLLTCGISISLFAERLFVELLFSFTNSGKYTDAESLTKVIKFKIIICR